MTLIPLPGFKKVIDVEMSRYHIELCNSHAELDEWQNFVNRERNKIYAARTAKVGLLVASILTGGLVPVTWNKANKEKLRACEECDVIIRGRRSELS